MTSWSNIGKGPRRKPPKACPVCGHADYRGSLAGHMSAWHPERNRPMRRPVR